MRKQERKEYGRLCEIKYEQGHCVVWRFTLHSWVVEYSVQNCNSGCIVCLKGHRIKLLVFVFLVCCVFVCLFCFVLVWGFFFVLFFFGGGGRGIVCLKEPKKKQKSRCLWIICV